MRPRFRALEAPRRGFLCSGGNSLVQQVAPPAEDTADDALIEDTTTPEVLAQEAAVLAGTAPDVALVPEAPAADAPAEPAATPTAQAVPTATESPPAPQPRTYSEAEVRQMQATARGRVEAERKQADEARRRLAALDLDARVEAHVRTEEQRLAQTMGTDEARAFARSPERLQQVRGHFTAEQRLGEIEAQRTNDAFEREVGAMVQTAMLFQQRYNVAEEDMEVLLATTTPVAMEKAAKRLGRQKAADARAVADRRALVPAETKATSLESGISGSSSPESDEARLERINRTPSWEWSDADYKYMKGH